MSKNKLKISYDKKSAVLSVEIADKKSADSDIQGNMVIDYDQNGRVVRVNIYEFDFDAFQENRQAFQNFARRSKVPLVMK